MKPARSERRKSERGKSERGPRRLVSAQELARAWRCHPTTVARLLRRAGIAPVVFTRSRNGLKRYRLDEIEAFVEECSGSPSSRTHTGRRGA